MLFKFNPGDRVFNSQQPNRPPVTITKPTTHKNWPHYYCVDDDGHEWHIPQIHLSQRPIND